MPQIELTVRRDDGRCETRTFSLAGDLTDLDAIDEAVERFKNAALPQVEQVLMTQAQEDAFAQEKKTLLERRTPERQRG